MSTSVVFIFVNYVDYSSFDRFLSSQISFPANVSVVVVDNTEPHRRSDEILNKWASLYPLRVIRADNVGYLGAVRIATEKMPEIRDSDYLLLGNTDLTFSLQAYAEILGSRRQKDRSGRLGMLAPTAITRDGRATGQQHYVRRPSARKFRYLARIFSSYPVTVLHRRLSDIARRSTPKRDQGSVPMDGRKIFAPHGAVMVFTRKYLEIETAFSFSEFLFCEEIFVGLTNSRAGLDCEESVLLTYSHEGHGSMGVVQSRRVVSFLRASHRWAASELARDES